MRPGLGGLMRPVQTPRCPHCGQLPEMILADGHQAFCGTDDCRVLTWDPFLTAEENTANSTTVDLGGLSDD